MSKVEFKISLDVLNALSPQKGMLNAKAVDLENQEFILHSMVAPEKRKVSLDKAVTGDEMYVKARYVNSKTKKSFLVPIRGLLNLNIASMPEGTKNVEFDAETMPTVKVHEWLMEKVVDGKPVGLPASFTVVSVKDRVQESTGNIMYPPYCYDAFSDKVDELRKSDPDASLDPIYQDFDFMQGLYANERSARFTNAEANKELVITI